MTLDDPFRIVGPASLSFSGGRTSAYMLWRVLQAHGGALPDDFVVTFANTGKEREETLRFVHECGSRWGVRIHWLEWRVGKPGFEEVGFNSASRKGEPFEAMLRRETKSALPNWQARWCTGFLKVGTMNAFRATLGMMAGAFTEVIGLRHDEGHRVLKGEHRAAKDGRSVAYPLAVAGITKADVMAFWATQDFDLGLKPYEGNCDLCFLKGKGIRKRLISENPGMADWWVEQEKRTGGFFDRRDRYAELVQQVSAAPDLLDMDRQPEYDTECGDSCGGDSDEEVGFMQRIYERRRAAA